MYAESTGEIGIYINFAQDTSVPIEENANMQM